MWLLFDVLHAFQEGGWGGRWFGSRILGEGEPGQIQFSTKKLSLELTDGSLPKGWECERGGTKVWEERQQRRREETTAACQVDEKYQSEFEKYCFLNYWKYQRAIFVTRLLFSFSWKSTFNLFHSCILPFVTLHQSNSSGFNRLKSSLPKHPIQGPYKNVLLFKIKSI